MKKSLLKIVLIVAGAVASLGVYAQDVDQLLEQGKKLNAEKKYTEAIVVLKKAEAATDNNIKKAYALLSQVEAQQALKQYAEADQLIEKMLALENIGPHLRNGALCSRGEIYAAQEKFAEAEEAYNKARALFKEPNLVAEFGLGQLYYREKKYDEAVKRFEVVAGDPNANKYLKAGSLIWQGMSYVQLKQPDKAKECYRKVIDSKEAAEGHKQQAADLLKQIK